MRTAAILPHRRPAPRYLNNQTIQLTNPRTNYRATARDFFRDRRDNPSLLVTTILADTEENDNAPYANLDPITGSPLPSGPVASPLTFYLHDHLGNTRVLFRADAPGAYAIDYAADYLPFGNILREYPGCNRDRFLSTHHERDAATGYDNRGARMYDGEIGRFFGVDPLAGEMPGWSPYNYVLGNPVRLVDPDGRSPEDHIFYLAVQAGADVDRDALLASTQKMLDANGINQQAQILDVSGEANLDDYTSGMDATDALAFVGSESFVEGISGEQIAGGFSSGKVGYVNLDGLSSRMSRGSEDFMGNVARTALHESLGHRFGGSGHPDEDIGIGIPDRYDGYYSPRTDQNVMTSGPNTMFSKDPYKTGGAFFLNEDLSRIKSRVPNKRLGVDFMLRPIVHNTSKDNLSGRLKKRP